jgi:hypothetical protein
MFEQNSSDTAVVQKKVTNDRVNAIKELNKTLQKATDYLYTIQLETLPSNAIDFVKK